MSWRQRTEHMPCAETWRRSRWQRGVPPPVALQHVAYVGNLQFSPTQLQAPGHGQRPHRRHNHRELRTSPFCSIPTSQMRTRQRPVSWLAPRSCHKQHPPRLSSSHPRELICYLRQASARATYPTSTKAATKGRQAACRAFAPLEAWTPCDLPRARTGCPAPPLWSTIDNGERKLRMREQRSQQTIVR